MCQPGSFNLSDSNADGCTRCECSSAGAVDTSCDPDVFDCTLSCDLVSGQCPCIEGVTGRRCDVVEPGNFVPRLDYFTVIGSAIPLTVPWTGMYLMLSTDDLSFPISGSLTYLSDGAVFQVPLNATSHVVPGSIVPLVQLNRSITYAVNTSTSIIFVPLHENLMRQDLGVHCIAVIQSGREERGECEELEYNVMLTIFRNPLDLTANLQEMKTLRDTLNDRIGDSSKPVGDPDCSCGNASMYPICDPVGGQCSCNEGAAGRTCGACLPGYFHLTEQGCVECGCSSVGAYSSTCHSETGTCSCLTNVIGDKCDRCADNFYGIEGGEGCIECNCSSYALIPQCDTRGQCACLPGVDGRECSDCLPAFHNLTSTGCTHCQCSAVGSISESCDMSGKCSCKPHVSGKNCESCVDGYRPLLLDSKPCTKCYCSGRTLSCSVSEKWQSYIIEDRWSWLDGSILNPRWTVVNASGSIVETESVIYHSSDDAQEVSQISITNSLESLSLIAPSKYLGYLMPAYHQRVSFTLGYNTSNQQPPPRTTAMNMEVRGGTSEADLITMQCGVGLVQPGVHCYNLQLSEYECEVPFTRDLNNQTVTDTRSASYPELLTLLVNVININIHVYGLQTGDVLAFHSFSLSTGVPRDPSSNATQLNSVELCQCPPEYQGDHCELCAPGFRMIFTSQNNSSFVCEPCDCNNHSVPDCEPDTGVCYCTHDTAGDHCNTCIPGYYGSPSVGNQDDCKPCTCRDNSSQCVLNVDQLQTCTNCTEGREGRLCEICQAGWFRTLDDGCTLCSCSNRSITCEDVTGYCNACTDNTSGVTCERCAGGWFGFPDNCTECSCSSFGFSGSCSHINGNCTCNAGLDPVNNCTTCLPGFYNATHEGCQECECDKDGALPKTSCNATTGECQCRRNVTGSTCDACQFGYYGANLTDCSPCVCSVEGTLPDSTCDSVSGQCKCLSAAIEGLSCDVCRVDTEGQFPTCALCGECFEGWIHYLDYILGPISLIGSNRDNLTSYFDGHSVENLNSLVNTIKSTTENLKKEYSDIQSTFGDSQLLEFETKELANQLTLMLTNISHLQLDANILNLTLSNMTFLNIIENDTDYISNQLTVLIVELLNISEYIYESQKGADTNSNSLFQLLERFNNLSASVRKSDLSVAVLNESLTALSDQMMNSSSVRDIIQANLTLAMVNASSLHSAVYSLNASSFDLTRMVNTSTDTVASLRPQLVSRLAEYTIQRDMLSQYLNTSLILLKSLNDTTAQFSVMISHEKNLSEYLKSRSSSNRLIAANLNASMELIDLFNQTLTKLSLIQIPNATMFDFETTEEMLTETMAIVQNISQTVLIRLDQWDGLQERLEYSYNYFQSLLGGINYTKILVLGINSRLDEIDVSIVNITQLISRIGMQQTNQSDAISGIQRNLQQAQYLTNEIDSCVNNQSEWLRRFGENLTALERIVDQNEQVTTGLKSSKEQLYFRLRTAAPSVQSAQQNLVRLQSQTEGRRTKIESQTGILAGLLSEYRSNEEKISTLSTKLADEERRLEQLMQTIEGQLGIN